MSVESTQAGSGGRVSAVLVNADGGSVDGTVATVKDQAQAQHQTSVSLALDF